MKQVFPMDSRVTYDAEGRPSYDRAVSSKPLRSLIRKLFTTGVMPNPSDTCQVRAGGDGMTLIVSPGLAVLEGGLYLEDAARTLSVTAADPTFDRIDTVVLRWNGNDAVRDCDLHVVAGVPAKNPVRPALTREGSIYEIGLADIFVTKGVATITNEKITDTRMESARCGIVSSVSEWDTTTIYRQIQSDLAGFKSNEQAEFMTWFNKMKDQLTTDAAGRLQTEVDDVRGQICTNLLNPIAPTQTNNGVTFTNNGDGTYTVNGTASRNVGITLVTFSDFSILENTKLVGCPTGGTSSTYRMYITCYNGSTWITDYVDKGNGVIVSNISPEATDISLNIIVNSGTTCDNLLFKPMLTTDLSATYDDFVPYTGDSGRLNEDVAALFDIFHPIGKLEIFGAEFNPNTAKGWHGVWEKQENLMLYAAGASDTVGAIVGSNTHTLSSSEIPAHNHPIPKLTGKAKSHGISELFAALSGTNFGVGFWNNGHSLSNYWPFSGGEADSRHEHDVETNESNTLNNATYNTPIDMRPRRLNCSIWMRTA